MDGRKAYTKPRFYFDNDAVKRAVDSLRSHNAPAHRVGNSLKVDDRAVRRAVESLRINDHAVRRAVQSLHPSDDAIQRALKSLKLNEDAVLRRSDQALSAGFDRQTQATALAISPAQFRHITNDAGIAEPVIADPLGELEQLLTEPTEAEDFNALYDWLEAMAPVARNRVFLGAMHALTAIIAQFDAEAGIEPPFHVVLVLFVLLAIADMWALADQERQ
ncbi:MAG TPA: hypothetical protein VG053_11515 [Solirubrobacteraceae bacterium]|jgi:hypothetical protein|nr:hypothetical protein [Solirubrobacteraceae bacterium]